MHLLIKLALTTTFSLCLSAGAWAEGDEPSIGVLAGATVTPTSDGKLITPATSIEQESDRGVRAHTNFTLFQPTGQASPAIADVGTQTVGLPPAAGYFAETPASLACVYGFAPAIVGCNTATLTKHAAGGGKAIVIVEPYNYPTALADLKKYSAQFGLPAPNLTIVKEGNPASSFGYNLEAAIDLQLAHAIAPNAKLVLYEATTSTITDIFAAVTDASIYAALQGGGEVFGGWSLSEYPGEVTNDHLYNVAPKVIYLATTGGFRAPQYPATSPHVIAVGGTSLSRNPDTGLFNSEVTWGETGAGKSFYFPRPAFQAAEAAKIGANKRAVPDISADANYATWVWTYYTGGWFLSGGGAVSVPIVAAAIDDANHLRANTTAELTQIYSKVGTASFHDIGRGYCGPHAGYFTTTGVGAAAWDLCTGVGSPNGLTGF